MTNSRVSADRPCGVISTRKASEPLTLAGDLHAAFLAWSDIDPEVAAVAAVARNDVELAPWGGARHRPAYALATADGAHVLADVVATPAELPATEAALADAAEAAGFGYRLETARTLRAEPRATTVGLVAAARGVPVPAADRVRQLAALDAAGTLPLVEAAASAS